MTDEERRFRIKELNNQGNKYLSLATATLGLGAAALVTAFNGVFSSETAAIITAVAGVNRIVMSPTMISRMVHAISEKTVLEVQMDEKEGRSR